MSSSGSKVYGSALYSIYTSLKSIFLSERLQIHKSSNWEQKIRLISAHFFGFRRKKCFTSRWTLNCLIICQKTKSKNQKTKNSRTNRAQTCCGTTHIPQGIKSQMGAKSSESLEKHKLINHDFKLNNLYFLNRLCYVLWVL